MQDIITEDFYVARFKTKSDERTFADEIGYVVHDLDIIYVSDSWMSDRCDLSARVSAFERMLVAADKIDGARIVYVGFGD